MVGFVMIYRDLLEWEWYQSPTVSRLYFHLILKVNFTDKKWQGIIIKRGQLVTSLNSLSSELKLSVQQIRTALSKLQEGNYVEINSTNNFTLITLVNYDKYQSSEYSSHKRNNIPKTNHQQSVNIPSTTTEKGNNNKNIKKVKIEQRCEEFKKQVFEHSMYSNKILNDFFNYWSEYNTAQSKMKYEKEGGYFEIERRLKKWSENEWTNSNKNNQRTTLSNR
ncbi:hypothetical protein [Gelidibacter mesophilus]|uniref:hypothetical protein n=1 Tax=Gelidibacter mesophilus TaxID=169050 RepID=UPI000403FC9E|nr:hypothetical protein [Gelidibacter mesophilus]